MDLSGPVSRGLFLWIQPMMRRGFKQPLGPADMPDLPAFLHPQSVYGNFEVLWAEEQRAAAQKKQPASLRACMRQLAGGWFCKAMLFQTVSVLLKFGAVLLLRRLVQILVADTGSEEDATAALIAALLLLLFSMLDAIVMPLATFQLQMSVYHVLISIAQAVLRKGAVLHPGVQDKFGRGDIVSMALSDCNRLVEMSQVFMQGAGTPIQMVVACGLLFVLMGPSVLVALVLIVIPTWAIFKIAALQGSSFRGKMGWMGQRLSVLNEMLQSVRFTKYYVMEDHYEQEMLKKRAGEEKSLRKMKAAIAVLWPVAGVVPMVTSTSVLTVHFIVHGKLPDVADTMAVLATARFMYLPFAFFGNFLGGLNMFLTCTARVGNLLLQPEIDRSQLELADTDGPGSALSIQGRSFTYALGSDEKPTLSSISLEIPKGELWAVVGGIGSGKSSLLAAVLGNIGVVDKVEGKPAVTVRASSRSYVAQEPMVMNATIRDNVLFGVDDLEGQALEKAYKKALRASALEKDLEILPAGDQTEVGEKGITLSGGQKARVALARAILAARPGGLVLLDDPLAAVDAHVAQHLFEEGMVGALAGTTRVLVTNQLHFLGHEQVAQILVMEGGRIVERGRQSELESDPESRYSKMLASTGHSKAEKAEEEAPALAQEERARQRSASSVSSGDAAAEKQEGAGADKARLTKDEGKREGAVTMSTFRFYFQHLGGGHVFALMVLSCWLFNLSEVGSDFYMALYQDGVIESDDTWALTVWICVAVAGGLATLFSRLLWVGLTMKACGAIHSGLVRRVLHCPTSFFDRTPSGRIMNRLGEDQMLVDWTAALVLEVLCICSWQCVDMLAIVIVARPLCAPIVAAMACLFLAMREVHRRASRETIRWWMITKSPMFHNIEETLSGASTIYAFGREGFFFKKFQGALHLNLQWLMARDCSNLWTEQRMGLLASCIVGALSLQVALMPDAGAGPAVSAYGIVQAMLLSMAFKTVSFMMVQVEGAFASVERVMEFSDELEQEPPWTMPDDALRRQVFWPDPDADLVFEGVSIRYLPHMPRALDGFSARFEPREKVGVVGRTGSGKSTLMSAVFRLIPLEEGRIVLGGVDVASLGLSYLRRQVTIVPQDPILFSGELRKNLDPLGQRTDEEMWTVLDKCSLRVLVEGLSGLETLVAGGGSNFSLGERQVICLARALLRNTRVLCLDEATASVDPVNDQRIQHILSTEVADMMTLTIAHRLHTVLRSDRILVLDAGRLAQFDTPAVLLKQPGIFKELANQAGIKDVNKAPAASPVGSEQMTL